MIKMSELMFKFLIHNFVQRPVRQVKYSEVATRSYLMLQ